MQCVTENDSVNNYSPLLVQKNKLPVLTHNKIPVNRIYTNPELKIYP